MSVTPEPTPFTLTGSRQSVDLAPFGVHRSSLCALSGAAHSQRRPPWPEWSAQPDPNAVRNRYATREAKSAAADQRVEFRLLLRAEFEVDCDATQTWIRTESPNVILRARKRRSTPLQRKGLSQVYDLSDPIW